MATPKKKHLIELMIEAGVKWPDGAEYAAQDEDSWLAFYTRKPYMESGRATWSSDGGYVGNSLKKLDSLCRNWRQTIVTREQYVEALAANVGSPAVMQSKSNQVRKSEDIPAVEWHNQPSIEQLTADYHAKAAEADRTQSVADEALKAADDALLALEKAGELLGLVVSIDTKPKHVEQQCSSAEWKIGDKCIVTDSPDDADFVGRECVIIEIDKDDQNLHYLVKHQDKGICWVRFIRRP